MAYKPPESAKELLERYAKGEREFPRANLSGANLDSADLSGTDLSGADLRHTNLSHAHLDGMRLNGADLRGTNLHSANLSGANLSGTNLSGANLDNADLNSANLSNANFHRANLSMATFTGANPSHAFFSSTDLSGADLRHTNLSHAHLDGMRLNGANLRGTDLSGANLRGTDLRGAHLHSANLSGTNLRGANLDNADLSSANLSGANLGHSQLGRVSLIELCKADPPVIHTGPSSIDFESITLSLLAPNLESFLVRAGIPAIAAQYMIESAHAVKGSVWDMMQSVFISFGGPDEAFARKLYEALHGNGVRTFFFPEHAEPGEKLHRMMRDGVNKHDRVVLICSKASLDRKGVLNEIEESLTRESRDGGEAYLIPIRLDDYVFSGWKPSRADIAQAVRDRVVADFEGTMTDQAKFDAALSKLLRALRVKNPAPASP